MAFNRHILDTEIEYLKGIGPLRASILKKELQIFTFYDLLNYFPFRYVDKSTIHKIADIQSDAAFIQLKGVISGLKEIGDGNAKRLVAELKDDSGKIELVWFKGIKWIKGYIQPGYEYLVFGKPSVYRSDYNIVHPELELFADTEEKATKIVYQPVYSATEKLTAKGLDSRGIMKLQSELLKKVYSELEENLPDDILKMFKLMPRHEAYRHIHFPADMQLMEKAKTRLKFEELFLLQLELLSFKWKRDKEIKGHIFNRIGDNFNRFYQEILPFELTNAQKKVLREIRNDLGSGRQMNRLLQGDVGSGKTVVALMCMLIAIDNGFQAALMAPTEILASQHYITITKMLDGLNIPVALLTGSTKSKERKRIHSSLLSSEIKILIGTHALIEDIVEFDRLGIAIIDEQHRFGVAQRAKFWKKGNIAPHVLIMTATPIPRTLAMTFYGDLENSIIDELPPGRKEIITRHYFESKRLALIEFLKKQIAEGRQIYIVYPLIDESEKMDYKNLMEGYDAISRDFPRPQYHTGIVHGRMKAADKETEMDWFKKGRMHILVSTTVIEVGVDVPNASVMVIESAERFGLSQLHQLRGRVGRGSDQSYCILMTSYKLSSDARVRMETMVTTTDGFKIAEVDMTLRGPGDIAGTQQSGLLNFKIANLVTDQELLKGARFAATEIITNDPGLQLPANEKLKNFLIQHKREKFSWSQIS